MLKALLPTFSPPGPMMVAAWGGLVMVAGTKGRTSDEQTCARAEKRLNRFGVLAGSANTQGMSLSSQQSVRRGSMMASTASPHAPHAFHHSCTRMPACRQSRIRRTTRGNR
eukprot:7385745-Prymnesium_polylepis.1